MSLRSIVCWPLAGPVEDEVALREWLLWIESFAARIDPLGGLREKVERVGQESIAQEGVVSGSDR